MDTLGSTTTLDGRPAGAPAWRPGVAAGVLAGVLLAACRAPAPARIEAAVRQPVQVRVAPAELSARAREPGSALILGTGAGPAGTGPGTGPGTGADRATLVPLAPAPGAVLVRAPGDRALLVAAWLVPERLPGATAPGVASGAALATGASPGVAEAPVAWAALRAAAHALGKTPTALGLAAVPGTDAHAALRDPLAGPAIAAGLLASLTGAPVRPAGAVGPGLLLPDHTVLPLPATADRPARPAAADEPARPATASKPARPATALADVRTAHALRTGTALPGPQPVEATAMALSPVLRQHLAARQREHRQALNTHWALLLGLSPAERVPASLRALIDSAQPHVVAAERANARGKVLAAHEHLVAAAPAATAAAVLWQVLQRLRAGEVADALAVVDALATRAGSDVESALRRIQDARPVTLAGHVRLAHAVQEWLVAAGMHAVAVALLTEHGAWLAPAAPGAPGAGDAGPDRERDQRIRAEHAAEAIAPGILALARAQAHAARAADALLLPDDDAGRAATAYRCTAPELAALAAHDLALSGASRSPGTDAPPGMAERLQRARLQAALAHGQRWADLSAPAAATGLAPAPASGPAGEHPASPAATFATACTRATAALAAAALARVEHGRLDLARHGTRARLAALVGRADRASREHARVARAATGFIPASSRLAYQAARMRAHMRDPAGALVRLWAASLHAELAVTLARHAR